MKSYIYLTGVVLLIVLVGFLMLSTGKSENIVQEKTTNPQVQIVKLSLSGGNYVLTPNTLKKDVPVRLEADSSVVGCARSVVISAFNIRKTISSTDKAIEFVPNKAGTFNIACSMNMYRGTFKVLDESGESPNYVEPVTQKSTTGCSMNQGGGCGCGG